MNTATIQHSHRRTNPVAVAVFWLLVGVPLAWGIWSTMQKAAALFH